LIFIKKIEKQFLFKNHSITLIFNF